VALNIKNKRTCELIAKLAKVKGESMTRAVTVAVEERLERSSRHKKEGVAEKLMKIARETGPLIKEPWKSTPHGELLYDDKGLPK